MNHCVLVDPKHPPLTILVPEKRHLRPSKVSICAPDSTPAPFLETIDEHSPSCLIVVYSHSIADLCHSTEECRRALFIVCGAYNVFILLTNYKNGKSNTTPRLGAAI